MSTHTRTRTCNNYKVRLYDSVLSAARAYLQAHPQTNLTELTNYALARFLRLSLRKRPGRRYYFTTLARQNLARAIDSDVRLIRNIIYKRSKHT